MRTRIDPPRSSLKGGFKNSLELAVKAPLGQRTPSKGLG